MWIAVQRQRGDNSYSFRCVTKCHLKCICISCFCYVRKTGSPSHNISVVKTFKKCYPPDFKFYLGKLDNKISPYGVMLFLSLFSLQQTMQKSRVDNPKLTLHHMGKNFISLFTKTIFKIWRVIFLKSFYHWEMGWTAGFSEITEIGCADAFEMTCRGWIEKACHCCFLGSVIGSVAR